MRTTQCVRAGWVIGAVGACMLVAGAARADVTTERPGSILIFPKVVANGTRDTVIQITNTSNTTDQARCFYLNGEKGRNGLAQCSETDFIISLTKQQPTNWLVSTGRNPTGISGLGPGLVPPAPAGFTGALICNEVDASLAPLAMNALKGEATLEGPGPDLSKYNGLAVQGMTAAGANDQDNDLNLDGVEYNACPAGSRVNFVAAGAPEPIISALGNAGICTVGGAPCTTGLDCTANLCVAGACTVSATTCITSADCPTNNCARFTCVGGLSAGAPCASDSDCVSGTCTGAALASVTTNVTVLPCNLDLNALVPTKVALNFTGSDENETPFSGSRNISCWDSFNLDSSLPLGAIPTEFATVDITAGAGSGILAVIETFHSDSLGNTASAATNAHVEGQCVGACVVAGSTSPPLPCLSDADCGEGVTCVGTGDIGTVCTSNADCGGGLCSGARFCAGGAKAGRTCTSDADCGTGTCPLPSAVIRLPGA